MVHMVPKNMNPKKPESANGNNGKHHDPNSSESVEASLEDFISQANASFPTGNTDGFSLHTGDVELLDEAEDELEAEPDEQVSAPIKVRGHRSEPIPVARRAEPSGRSEAPRQSRSMPAVQPVMVEPEPQGWDSDEADAEPLDPPPSGPRRRVERTEVVAAPSSHAVPWTSNPLLVIGGLLAAFIIGAGLVFLMVRTMMPTQPVVVQAPAPQVVVQPAAAQPVVTPLPQTARPASQQPVVTPLPQPAQAQPQPIAAQPARAEHHHTAHKHAVEKHASKPAQAERPAKPAHEAKSSSKKSDWVDPFAQ